MYSSFPDLVWLGCPSLKSSSLFFSAEKMKNRGFEGDVKNSG
jgi:hypothetical protein